MKLFITTCLKESKADVAKIFKQANINIFSTSHITGHKGSHNENLLEDWFASGDEQYDSIMLFSFTDDTCAALGLELIKTFNTQSKPDFPLRAFILPVEASAY
jgi:hypothetical protein